MSDVRLVASWCLSEVFILMELREVVFVSVVDTWVMGTSLVQNGEIWEKCVDSIGVTMRCVCVCGSADSKGVRLEIEVMR